MKAYFTASLRGTDKYLENYTRIVKVMEGSGFKTMTSDVLMPGSVKKVYAQTQTERYEAFQKLTKKLKQADLVVAEISTPSISIGYEVTHALELSKPVVVLHTKGNGAVMLEGMKHEKLQVVEYSPDSLEEKLKKALTEAQKSVDVRFNFFVSPKILAYLDWVAQKRMVPRSVFLRDLIEKELRKDKEFRQ
jgi:hypothetical protein